MFAYQLSTTDLREGICEAEKLSRFIDYLDSRDITLAVPDRRAFAD